jgi:SAM-dependent methyltransferase
MYKTITQCRVCGNTELDSLLNLGMQALTGVFPTERDAPVPSGPLELVKCREEGPETCGLVQLRDSFQAGDMYGMNYGYRSGLNRSMVDHLQGKARKIKDIISLSSGDLVLDIGSNDSTLLRAMDEPGVRLVGMDPSGIKFRQYYPANAQLIPDFFSADRFRKEFGRQSAKVVTSIAMFYDLDAPLEFVRQVYEVLADDGIWVFEQSYLPFMLANTSYDTMCHEHLEYYALKQVQWMLERVGFVVLDVEFNNINGGSFSVTAAKAAASYRRNEAAVQQCIREEEKLGLSGMEIYRKFHDRVFQHRDELLSFLRAACANGERILGYGASTKGNVILQFCGITVNELACIAEVNPDKFGAFAPGTLIPIISEDEARAMNPGGFLVLPWHFRDNIVARETQFLASGGRLIFPLPRIEVISEESVSRGVQWAGWNLFSPASRG